jgi:hypothetical protein
MKGGPYPVNRINVQKRIHMNHRINKRIQIAKEILPFIPPGNFGLFSLWDLLPHHHWRRNRPVVRNRRKTMGY